MGRGPILFFLGFDFKLSSVRRDVCVSYVNRVTRHVLISIFLDNQFCFVNPVREKCYGKHINFDIIASSYSIKTISLNNSRSRLSQLHSYMAAITSIYSLPTSVCKKNTRHLSTEISSFEIGALTLNPLDHIYYGCISAAFRTESEIFHSYCRATSHNLFAKGNL